MSYADLKKKTVEELELLVLQLKAELFSLKYKNSIGDLKETHKIKELRNNIAKALTALNERKGAK
ncbi:50S ribosomal protein L29 [Mycoplasmopsis canis UFG4]|uniref:Large ribosomal subunit protein uL29 n=2 Tax=Mycoplasmopsis canis TaxID=29555 RepID=I1A4P4_9BACT|nr:50S ribosomal protein L29 [Mycoplasmopsis canis]AKF41338.1 50S ribosomal protein L29 [Mycoplasmopsis canis]AMD81454.1 50S ribosomal protein L29 [Mycoplasmopsis canis PG 14]EIE39374.1 50S ribosomal protein L29 [Mycoplasmopsis canis UF33]EIE39525.1 50S ribosomal protein L29 [Mycoplasmopsis canis PG 14]EIE39679.1 50S ribosomal protein L29 [Mycoplasmopsis canis UF31]